MQETPVTPPSRPSLLPTVFGLLLALLCAVWAGARFAFAGSGIGYGVLTGLAFGALFAYAQRIRRYFFPAAQQPRQAIPLVTRAAEARPTQRSDAHAATLQVVFDDSRIRMLRNDVERDSIAWQEIAHIVIQIDGDIRPLPYWLLLKDSGGLRIPNNAIGLEQLLEQCKTQLPGYDSEATYATVITAMGAMTGSFAIWPHPSTD